MLNEVFYEILKHEGVVSVVSSGSPDAHVANTWNSYLHVKDSQTILIPAFGFRKTQANTDINNKIKITLGSEKVQGKMGLGTGVLIEGTVKFSNSGEDFDRMKEKFNWMNRVIEVTVRSIKQTV